MSVIFFIMSLLCTAFLTQLLLDTLSLPFAENKEMGYVLIHNCQTRKHYTNLISPEEFIN